MQADFGKANGYQTAKANKATLSVLLVDDKESTHEMLGLALEKTEYSLVSTTNVQDAMKVISSSYRPDIVITDAMMPGNGCSSLISSIKANPATSGIPVILWTVQERQDRAGIDSSGKPDITMRKPFELPDILDSLMRAKQLIKPNFEMSF
jgi:CheY-like chemotaxis protein